MSKQKLPLSERIMFALILGSVAGMMSQFAFYVYAPIGILMSILTILLMISIIKGN